MKARKLDWRRVRLLVGIPILVAIPLLWLGGCMWQRELVDPIDWTPTSRPHSVRELGDDHYEKWLKVPQGQLTFDLEGNDIVGSPHFSRTIHHPGWDSGVTVGRGYDMRWRSGDTIIRDLTTAGVSPENAGLLANAAGLTGTDAQAFVLANRGHGWATITRKQQHLLFNRVYPAYLAYATDGVNRAQRWGIRFDDGRIKMYPAGSRRTFAELPPSVQEVAADIAYNVGPTNFGPGPEGENWGGIFQMDTPQEMADYISGGIRGDILDAHGRPTGHRAETRLESWRKEVPERARRLVEVLRSPAPTPSIHISSPNGGEVWPVGSTQIIRWTSSNIPSTSRIHIFYWYNIQMAAVGRTP